MTAATLIDYAAPEYYDSPQFKAYVKLIESVLSDEPKTIAQIHRELGDKVIPAFTLDALAWSDRAQEIPGYLSRFVRVEPKKKERQTGSPGWSGDGNAKLFAKDGARKETPYQETVYGKFTRYGMK